MRARAFDVLRRILAGVVSVLLVAGGVGLLAPAAARADSAPADPANPATPATVTADPLPTVQINGVVWAQVVVGNTVYAAGQFTRARPAGAPAGTQETVRNNLLAYDIRTGALVVSFAPDLNAQARAITASPDGRRIYVGGDFTRANGQVRNKVAAYDTATGQLVADWRPSVTGRVVAVAATNATVYLGGTITAVGSVGRNRLAAVRAADGGLLPWAPQPGAGPTDGNKLPLHDANNAPIPGTRDPRNDTPSNDVLALVVTNGGAQVVAAGRFYTLNGVRATGVGALDAVTGAVRPFAVNQKITNHGINSAVYSLSTDGATVYGTGYDFWGPGNLEGAFTATAAGGAARWYADCRGDSYSAHGAGGVVYIASHSHDCANIDSFPEQPTRVFHHGNAFSAAPTGLNRRVSPLRNNTNLVGQPAPTRLAWDPSFAVGTFTGQYQAGWSVTGTGGYVVYGGEFPRVNGVAQQGLVRFAVRSLAPNAVAPRATGAFQPTATPIPGAVRISWRAVHDPDNENLGYQVYRDVASGTPVCQVTLPSQWWDLRSYGCADTTATAGSHRYLVVATDPLGNRLASSWATASVGLANRSVDRPYARLVAADGAQDHWSLGETGGTIARDRLVPQDMTIYPGVTKDQVGATADGNRAFGFNGTSGYLASATAVPGPNTFSVEAWFSTTTRVGGKIVGFGNARTGTSTNFDRHIYMDPTGRVNFGVYNGAAQLITTPAAYNDGGWHHVVGTLGRNGMSLYVDGQLVRTLPRITSAQYYSGFWRVGGDTTWWGSRFFAGRIDEVAVYPTALSAQQVAGHNTAARTGQAPNAVPTASFTAAPNHLEVALDASTSGDPDGRLTRFAWDFGDGSTGEGTMARHTYAAAGTYTVRLTVTDDRAGTATTAREVTVTAPPVGPGSIAADAFGREVSGAWGEADAGGTWLNYGGAANLRVTGGQGHVSAGPATSAGGTLPVSAQDVAVQADVVLDAATTGGGSFLGLAARSVGGTRYKTQVWFAADGSMHMGLFRVVDWAETWLTGTALPGRYTPGTALTVRFEVDGTSLRAKAWAKGTAEPADWQVRTTDTTAALQRPGGLRLDLYTARSATAATVVRVDDLRAEPAGTVVAQPEPAPNAAPTAAFTATPTDLTAAVDASTSSDADGRVTGYAWDFGDGGTAAGVTASHTYAAAGTYQVRLTVTDDAGATGAVTRAVAVTAPVTQPPADQPPADQPPADQPPAVQPIAADAFGREVADGWGTADVGGTWFTYGGAGARRVTGGQGHVSAGPATSAGGVLPVSAQDVAVQADVLLDAATTGGGSYLGLAARSVGGTRYKTQVWFAPDGSMHMGLFRVVDWAETWLTGTALPGRYTPGTALTVRFEVSGTSLRAKAWAKGTAEPADWQVRTTDTTAALQRPGGLRLDLYTARSATAATVVRVDDLWAGPAGTVPPAA